MRSTCKNDSIGTVYFVIWLNVSFLCPFQAAEGTGLAFIVFTQAIVELPGAPFWAIIFFLMLLSLGIGSQIGILEGMLSCIFDIDFFKRIRKPYLTGKINMLYISTVLIHIHIFSSFF